MPAENPTSAPTQPAVTAPERRRKAPRRWAQRLLGPFYVTGVFWCRAIVFGTRMPDPLVTIAVAVFSTFFFCCLRRLRRVIATNLAPVLGPCGFLERQRRIFRTLHATAWFLVERFEQFRPRFELQFEFEGDAWPELLRGEQGFVMLTAHFGNWEMGPLTPLPLGSRKVHVMREMEEDAATQRYLESLMAGRPRSFLVTHFADDDPQLGATLLLALRRGDIVALSGDRPREGMPTLRSPMFGREVAMPAGPYALARAAEMPLVPVFLFRTGRRRYRVVGRPPFQVERTRDRSRDLGEAARRFAAEVEWAIREAPHHWVRSEAVWATGA